MGWLLALAGVLWLALTLLDFFRTTLSFHGAGPIGRVVPRAIWLALLAAGGRSRPHRFLPLAGPAVLLGVFGVWVALIWTAWALIFLACPGAVESSPGGVPADFGETVYFTGYVVTTLGTGDFVPRDDVWRMVSVVCALNGLLVISLSITYIFSVMQAVIGMRTLALRVHASGDAAGLVSASWNGHDLSALQDWLRNMGEGLYDYSQRQQTYPIIDYFWSRGQRTDMASAAAIIADTVLLCRCAVSPAVRPSALVLDPVEDGLRIVAGTAESHGGGQDRAAPPPPGLIELAKDGIPVVEEDRYGACAAALDLPRAAIVRWLDRQRLEWPGNG